MGSKGGLMNLKYELYELSVQSPKRHIDWFAAVYHELRGTYASRLREDFCGTFRLSCEWVKRNWQNTAVGLDLDPEPLAYGHKNHMTELTPEQKKRLKILKRNVLKPGADKVDLIVACNFSFFIFKERATLVEYFKACRNSLKPGGVALFELAGGAGMIQTMREKRIVRHPKAGRVQYVWHQKSFDPITCDGQYAIHFKLPSGKSMTDAFTYDWRLWSIPETRDALRDAGFKDICVYWEAEHKGVGTGEFLRTEKGDNAHAWIAYVIGMV